MSAAIAYAEGLSLARAGRHYEAIGRFEAALRESENDLRVLFALANAARDVGHDGAAERLYRAVLAVDPDCVEALVNLANLLRARGAADTAIDLVKAALARNEEAPELWLTLGSAVREAGDAAKAEIFYREALRQRPDYGQALGNLADLLADRRQLDEAIALYDRVLDDDPHFAQARLNRAILYFLQSRLAEGWRDYAMRLKVPGALQYEHLLPKWDGGALTGKRLLVSVEQGIGDQIMFASVLPDLAARAAGEGGSVVLECEPRLVDLFARSFPHIAVHACDVAAVGGQKTAHYDWLPHAGGANCAVELGTLPRYLRASLDEFPDRTAYLVPDVEESARWNLWLRAQGKRPFIGLCWRSGKTAGLRGLQYAPLELWAPFLRKLPGTLVSLQYDAREDELAVLQTLSGRTIHVPPRLDQKSEIDRTVALVANLDAAVSAPTAVSWMTAAAGVPTFRILYDTSWTAFGEDYEPFAPACRCVRPKKPGDWTSAFLSAAAALTTQLSRP